MRDNRNISWDVNVFGTGRPGIERFRGVKPKIYTLRAMGYLRVSPPSLGANPALRLLQTAICYNLVIGQ